MEARRCNFDKCTTECVHLRTCPKRADGALYETPSNQKDAIARASRLHGNDTVMTPLYIVYMVAVRCFDTQLANRSPSLPCGNIHMRLSERPSASSTSSTSIDGLGRDRRPIFRLRRKTRNQLNSLKRFNMLDVFDWCNLSVC